MSPRGQQAMGFGVPPLTRGVKWLGGATLAVSVLTAVLGDTGSALAQAVLARAKASNRTLTESEVAQIVREVRS